MWVNRQVYLDLQKQLADVTAQRNAQLATIGAIEASMNWLTVHVSQLEHERSILLKNYLGVTVPALTIKQTSEASGQPMIPGDSPNHFDDVGDDEAQRMGIDWNPLTGEINYNVRETK